MQEADINKHTAQKKNSTKRTDMLWRKFTGLKETFQINSQQSDNTT